MHTLIHRGGPMPCGRPAIRVRLMPNPYEIAAENVRRLDGSTPQRGDPMICGTCNQPIVPQWLFDLATMK